ncbi:non-homologous end joining protein Ku [Pseudoduganella umbonata]|uniref:Non-homologous end joining protein Ku n=1 Tax=Pseudoduganella umbonata TaxID=864828 RepID=A0A4P8HM12_9BURK|nr:Ku protein [Pseudoduganella umbonata]MBB3219358.1 DNA end-binding protein Ku [Pseudoduganella umbonata]QCP09454.1 Ku protein [Pseudoduganella umbonata]
MARSLWKGAISFGLVHIPVDLYSAVKQNELDLTMLDKRDFSPIGFKRYNKGNGKEVAWDNIIKGYEYTSGEYVVLSDEDLKRANVKATQTIDIISFVNAEDVPLTYYETPYYLAPGRGGAKVYALLRETLRRAGRIGIATVVIRTKQHLCALVASEDGIIMNTLRYADEIRDTEGLDLPEKGLKGAGISDKELKMALSLVEGMSEEWDPSLYHDTYKEDVLALVEKKVKAGQTKSITMPSKETEAKPASNVIDLVALLQQSLGNRPGKGKKAAAEEVDDADDESGDEDAAPEQEDKKPAKKAAPRKAASASGTARAAKTTAAIEAAPKTGAAKAAASKPAAPKRTAAKSTAATRKKAA